MIRNCFEVQPPRTKNSIKHFHCYSSLSTTLPEKSLAFCQVNLLFVKRLASLHEAFGTYRERMMHAIFDDCAILRFLPLAQKDVMIADIKSGHHVVAEAP